MKKFLLVLSAVFVLALSITPVRHALAQGATTYFWGGAGNSSKIDSSQGGSIELGATSATSDINPVTNGRPYSPRLSRDL